MRPKSASATEALHSRTSLSLFLEWASLFKDRKDAGRLLAEALSFLKAEREDLVVVAIPRGGVVVAKAVADALRAPLDVVVTRKIGAPGNPELAIGAVTQDGEVITDPELVTALKVSDDYVKGEAARQVDEIRRRMKEYGGERACAGKLGRKDGGCR